MAELVKWLTRQIVALVCMGSIPIFRPIYELTLIFQGFIFFMYHFGVFFLLLECYCCDIISEEKRGMTMKKIKL